MSNAGVDIDRLAEYAAGLLDAHEATEVERLVAERPDWARALAALQASRPRVHAALAGLGDVRVPDDVAQRLEAALADAASRGRGADRAVPSPAPTPAKVIDLASRRRRWARVAAVAAAAVVLAGAGLGGVAVLVTGRTQRADTASGAPVAGLPENQDNRVPATAGVAPDQARPPLVVLATGTDYTATTVAGVGARAPSAADVGGSQQSLANNEGRVPAELARLAEPAARDACLAAVTARHGGTPTLLDYAYYRNEPALVIVLAHGGSRIVVVGPRCGLPGAGSDTVAAIAG